MQVSIAGFAVLTGVVAIALLFISSSLSAAFASFLVAVSTVCFIMAFFFSSLTVVYVGALGFGGLTIGSIAFFSVWAVIILSGDLMHPRCCIRVQLVNFLMFMILRQIYETRKENLSFIFYYDKNDVNYFSLKFCSPFSEAPSVLLLVHDK